MPIPDFQSTFLPLLKFLSDGQERTLSEAVDAVSAHFKLTEEEKKQLLPSGQQSIIRNRVAWGRTYLTKAGLIESAGRGLFRITQRGRDVLTQNLSKMNVSFLKQFPEFAEFHKGKKTEMPEPEEIAKTESKTPEEVIALAYQRWRENLAVDLIESIKKCSPEFFEKLVVELLLAMGYGGTRQDAGQAIGKSGDGGIDGIIKEDRLGLDILYIQAKRWENPVGSPEIHKFAGALQGQKARKGIFITTSTFTKDANRFASSIENKIVLIDGEQLAQLMIDHNIGVNIHQSYELKRLDLDYFTEED